MNVDTLAIAKRMIRGGFSTEQAETSAQIIGELVDSDIATKRDLKELDTGLKRDIKELETSLQRDIKELETSLKRDMKELETNLKRDINESELRLEKSLAELHRQMLQLSVGTALMIVTVLGFLFRFLGK